MTLTPSEKTLCHLALTAFAIRCDRSEAEMRALSALFGRDDPQGAKALANAEASKTLASDSRALAQKL